MDVWNLAKGLGVIIVGTMAFSGNSAIAKINQGMTLESNLNAAISNIAIKNSNRLEDDALKINYSIKQTQSQNRSAVDNKKTLLAGCYPKCP